MYFVIKNEDGSIFRCGPIEGPIPGAWVRGARTLEVAPDDDPQVTAWREQLEREASLAAEEAQKQARLAEEQARLAAEAELQAQARRAEREALRAGLEGASTTAKLREAMLALMARLEALEGR